MQDEEAQDIGLIPRIARRGTRLFGERIDAYGRVRNWVLPRYHGWYRKELQLEILTIPSSKSVTVRSGLNFYTKVHFKFARLPIC